MSSAGRRLGSFDWVGTAGSRGRRAPQQGCWSVAVAILDRDLSSLIVNQFEQALRAGGVRLLFSELCFEFCPCLSNEIFQHIAEVAGSGWFL